MPDQGLIGFVGKGAKQCSVALPKQTLTVVNAYLASCTPPPPLDQPLIKNQDRSGKRLNHLVINRGRRAEVARK
jgi:site-specific recombinase XerC